MAEPTIIGSGQPPSWFASVTRKGGSDAADLYVRGWEDCADAIASLCELKARELLGSRSRLPDRLLHPAMAEIYRHAAEIARATTVAEPEKGPTP